MHPDVCKKSNATKMFQLINNAYQTLIDDKLREEYDWLLNEQTFYKSNKKKNTSYEDFNEYYEYDEEYAVDDNLNEYYDSFKNQWEPYKTRHKNQIW